MKEMEAKTENRYEYRKPQEKRKQMIAPDLFEFAYVPDWYGHLAELERLALPESWRFRKPSRETENTETPILERYIHTIFRKQVIDFNSESDPRKADSIFHLENECVCFHTGLYTPQYKGIYGYFERNNFSDSLRDWYFRGFCDELSPKLRYIEPLPQKPVYHMAQSGINFNPEWPIRVNVNHILGDEENLERIPAKIRKVKNLPLLFETAVELGRRKSFIIRRLKDHIMKRLVCLCDTCYIVTVKHLFKSGSSGMKFVYFLLINAVTRKLYGKFFKRTPNFQYVAQIFFCNLRYLRAFSRYHEHKSFQFQLSDRFPDRRSAHSQFVCKLYLHQPLSGL